jgi:cytochrome P450/NADPH-cytochrome P450 reductase
MEDPNQKVGYAVVVSTKPVGLFVKIEDAGLPEPTEEIVVTKRRESKAVPQGGVQPAKFPLPPVTFLFGTQTSTSEEYARKLSGQAKEFGFQDVKVQDLDDWKLVKGEQISRAKQDANAPSSEDDVKVSELVVVVTATYNGFPPDNAIEFSKWLDARTKNTEETKENMLSGMLYSVFGCGNRDWTSTFQKFPRKVDNGFELLGGERLLPAGEGDASDDIDGDFSVWSAGFWTALMQRYGQSSSGKNVDIMTNNGPAADPSKDFTLEFINIVKDKVRVDQAKENRNQLETVATIVENRELQTVEKSHRSTRHIQVKFGKGVDGKPLYEAGDHLEVVPANEDRLVEIIATNLGLVLDSAFEIKDLEIKNISPRSVAANIKGPCTIRNALKYYADLTGPPTRFTLTVLSKQLANTRPDIAERLQNALQPGKETQRLKDFLASHRTLIDIIEAFKIKELNFKEFISSINCIIPRKYSISSGPLEHPFDPSIVSFITLCNPATECFSNYILL